VSEKIIGFKIKGIKGICNIKKVPVVSVEDAIKIAEFIENKHIKKRIINALKSDEYVEFLGKIVNGMSR